ncbi:hypothetical protein OGAPHI_005871 [Ogataea philodendri]|uniref:Uncharacterized protein n=1 Tax=Ogataea philodendri TaxID=1378263 RepID=A0A9P8P026_9ASCO|nr:uncharacterized protein OGAPHI_005871 [Ogataea philodendri]KAH3662619.1 hypothetical protein OGAPHI_005871 [Ogataea philodendri]
MTIVFLSPPINTLSLAHSRWFMLTLKAFWCEAYSAAWLTRFFRAAPDIPVVVLAITEGSTSFDTAMFFRWCLKMARRPLTSGRSTLTTLSNLPGLVKALSNESGKLVAPMMMIPSFSDSLGSHTHIQLVELGSRHEEERDASLSGSCTGKQSLTGTWRACEQNTLWKLTTKTGELGRIFQKLNNFLELGSSLVNTTNIGEFDGRFANFDALILDARTFNDGTVLNKIVEQQVRSVRRKSNRNKPLDPFGNSYQRRLCHNNMNRISSGTIRRLSETQAKIDPEILYYTTELQ